PSISYYLSLHDPLPIYHFLAHRGDTLRGRYLCRVLNDGKGDGYLPLHGVSDADDGNFRNACVGLDRFLDFACPETVTGDVDDVRSEEHTSELQSRVDIV